MRYKGTLEKYQKHTGKKVLFGIFSTILLLLLTFFAMRVGTIHLSFSEIFFTLLGENTEHYNIIWKIRLPQILTAIVAGSGLAIAGAVMQSILRNPLGSPFTLGISQAAAFGAAFSIVVLGAGTTHSSSADAVIFSNPYMIPISAFMWSLISTLLILALAKYKKASPETMILTGVALGSLFTAGLTSMKYFASDVELASIVFWQFGDVGRTTWNNLTLMAVLIVPIVIYFIYKSWDYNALDMGDETAQSLGANVDRLRMTGMLLSSFVTALIISFVGIIGFVGLVVPHIVRKIVGGDERFLIPCSCIIGALLLLASDLVAKTIISPIVLPVGILTSFIGAPLFIYLVVAGREYW